MANVSRVVDGGLRSTLDEEIVIDIRPNGIVSCPWLTLESDKILSSIGKVPERFKGIGNYCG